MLKKIVLQFLLLISVQAFSQKCFEGYKPNYPKNPTMDDFTRVIQEFSNFVKDCKAPDFNVTTLDGEMLELSKLKGKVVVINFWFIECAPCIAEIPALNKLVAEYKTKDVVFIGMSRSSMENIQKNFLPNYKFDFKIVADCKLIAEKYKKWLGWPTTFVLDKKGKVKFVKCGGFEDDRAKTEIEEKLKPVIDGLL